MIGHVIDIDEVRCLARVVPASEYIDPSGAYSNAMVAYSKVPLTVNRSYSFIPKHQFVQGEPVQLELDYGNPNVQRTKRA